MKTNRSLVVIVSLITATLLLTACAQPEQSSLAGDWLLTPKDKTRGLTGSIAVNIAPFRCKTNCRGDNLPDNTRRWQLSGGNEKELTYLHNMSAQEKVGLNPGWQCYTSFFMRVCQGKPGTRPIVNEDYVSESGFFGSMMHVGIIELRRCQSENCQQELGNDSN
ncbi:hypothetical protein OCN75_13230, partial [Escherichia coli]